MKRDIFIRLLTSRSAALPPNTLVFNSQTPGSYSVDVKKGIYLLEISGGGGKAGKSDIVSKSVFSGGGGGGGAAFKGNISIDTPRKLLITVGKGGTGVGPTINGYGIANSDGEWGGTSKIEGMVVCDGGRGGMFGAVRNNVAPGGAYNFITPNIIVSTVVAGVGNGGGKGDMNSPAWGAASKLTGAGGGAPHGGNGTDPGTGGAGTTLAVTWGGNGANGIVKLTYISKIPS